MEASQGLQDCPEETEQPGAAWKDSPTSSGCAVCLGAQWL